MQKPMIKKPKLCELCSAEIQRGELHKIDDMLICRECYDTERWL